MAEKDIKKSLSLKSHKSSGSKQSKLSVGSKNVTIQVKRKKIINPTNITNQEIAKKSDNNIETLVENSTVVENKNKEISI